MPKGPNTIPELNPGTTVIDWSGLTRDLQDLNKKWEPISQDVAIDVDGLWRDIGYNESEKNKKDALRFKVGSKQKVDYNDEGNAWYTDLGDFVLNDAPNFIADQVLPGATGMLVPSMQPLIAAYLSTKRWLLDFGDPEHASIEKLKELKKSNFRPEDPDWVDNFLAGVEEGVKQNLSLIIGGEAETIQEKRDQLEVAGTIARFKAGEITKEELQKYYDYLKLRQDSTPIMQDIVAGITNSALIMSELIAGGGLVAIGTKGLKFASKAYWKQFANNLHKMGKQTWNIMKYGATINAVGDAIQEAKEDEDSNFWSFSADVLLNNMREHTSAYMEGMTEGLLRNTTMASVSLKKWLGTPVTRLIKGREVKEFMGVRKLRQMFKTAKLPTHKVKYQRLLNKAIQDRKDIAKTLLKNTKNKIAQGLFVETATEQVTDAWSDLVERNSHASAVWLLFGDDKEKQEALRNLIVEASVGLFLGMGMGIGEIWSYKPLEEIEKKYGKEVREKVEEVVTGQDLKNTVDRVKETKQKSKYEHNIDTKQEANTTSAIQKQGTNKQNTLIEDEEDQKVWNKIEGSPSFIATTLKEVGEIKDANVLDFVYGLNLRRTQAFLSAISKRDEGRLYQLDSYMEKSDEATRHAVLKPAYDALVWMGTERGLMDRLSYVPKEHVALKQDLLLGIIREFDIAGWSFIKGIHKDIPGIETLIAKAQELQEAKDLKVVPTTEKFVKLLADQTVSTVQKEGEVVFKKVIAENIGTAVAFVGAIKDTKVVYDEDVEPAELDQKVEQGFLGVAEVIHDPDGEDAWLRDREPGDLFDEFGNEWEHMSQVTEEKLVDKAKGIANLTSTKFLGFKAFPGSLTMGFFDPMSKQTFEVDHSSLRYKSILDKVITLRGGTPMYAVAFRYKGKVLEAGPANTHPSLAAELFESNTETDQEFWDKYESGEVEEGFIDGDGKFYTRDEAKVATGIEGEAVTQGIKPALDQLVYMGQLPTSSGPTLPKMDTVIGDFEGNTIQDFVNYLLDREIVNKSTLEVAEKLLPVVGRRLIKVGPMKDGVAGGTNKTTLNIAINTNGILFSPTEPWDALVHEMLHSYLHGFMAETTNDAKIFNGKIEGVLNTVKQVIAKPGSIFTKAHYKGDINELKQWVNQHFEMLRKAMGSNEEFITSVMSDTQDIKFITDRIEIGGAAHKITGWRRIAQAIADAMGVVGVQKSATQELHNILERRAKQIAKFNQGFNKAFNAKVAKEHMRLNKNVSSGYEVHNQKYDEDEAELLDQVTEDEQEENRLENASIDNFIKLAAEMHGATEGEFRQTVQTQYSYYPGNEGFEQYLKNLDEMDTKNGFVMNKKLQFLFRQYKDNFATFDDFKRSFMKRKYLNVVKKTEKPGYVYMSITEWNPATEKNETRFELRKVKGTYRDGNGKKRNTFKRDIVLEGFLPLLEEKLGLPTGTFTMAYMEGFETWRNGKSVRRSSLDRLDPYMFNPDHQEGMSITGYIANNLWGAQFVGAAKEGMLYIGNFAGKNTLPFLTFDGSKKMMIQQAIARYQKAYEVEVMDQFKEAVNFDGMTEAAQMSSTTRAILEDLWFESESRKDENGSWAFVNEEGESTSKAAKQDWNKTMKRAPKWTASDTGILINEQEFKRAFKNASVNGTTYDNNDVLFNTAVINVKDNGIVSFEAPNGHKVELPLSELLQNSMGTSIIDGASYYIHGHFDKIYKIAHGVLKDGTFKNLYSSKAGEAPLFIKHAMHGIGKDTMIGRWMIENNIAILVANDSMKEGPQEKMIGALELADKKAFAQKDPLFQLRLSQFTRMSESEYKDPMGGSTKQLSGGSSFSEIYNDVIKALGGSVSLNQILKDFSEAMSHEATEWFKENTTPEATHDLLRSIVYNPTSPQEESVSEIWIDYIEPLEGQTDADVRDKYAAAWQHAHTAEVLRLRMQHKLVQLLDGKTAGTRATLQPNPGWGNFENDIAPLETTWNLGNIMVGADVKSDVLQAALPEQGLLTIVRNLVELQRQESRTQSQLTGEKKKWELSLIHTEREAWIQQIKDLESERLKDIVTSKTTSLSPHSLIDWSNPKVKAWRDEVVYGTKEKAEDSTETIRKEDGIIDEKTGRLRGGWTIITEDIADMHGIKPGDWVLVVVTPTDSPMGIRMVRVGGIAKSKESKVGGRKVSDNNKAIFNSEWLQTLVGKDFDIDTISIMPYDPRFWKPDNWKSLAHIASQVPDAYAKEIAKETKRLFDENKQVPKDADGNIIPINKETVFANDTMRQVYSILMNGVSQHRNRRSFPIMGNSFIDLDTAYLHDPAPIIVERRYHTALSALNVRSKGVTVPFITKDSRLVDKFKIDGKESKISLNFNVRNPNWFRLHVNHLHMTNAEVDFPNKTTRLAYVSNPKTKAYRIVMGSHFWGLEGQRDTEAQAQLDRDEKLQDQNRDSMFKALKLFNTKLFGSSFSLAQQKNSETFDKLDYYHTLQQLRNAQKMLHILDTKNKPELHKVVDEIITTEIRKKERNAFKGSAQDKAMQMHIDQMSLFLHDFVEKMELDNVYDYPLFNTIRGIQAEEMLLSMPGNTYKDHLINQVLASLSVVGYYPMLAKAKEAVDEHAPDNAIYTVQKKILLKPAIKIAAILKEKGVDKVKIVEELLANIPYLDEQLTKLGPADLQDYNDAMKEFKQLQAKVGKAYKPFPRDGKLYNVDDEAIALSLMAREMDFQAGRLVNDKLYDNDPIAYWGRQLRGLKAEVNAIMHAFDETGYRRGRKTNPSEQQSMIRAARSVAFPMLWKSMLSTPYLFVAQEVKEVTLYWEKKEIKVTHDNGGQLIFRFEGENFNHNEINAQKSSKAIKLYGLLTQRNGLWEGTLDTKAGTHNRAAIGELIRMPRNITMERRQLILEQHLADNLYAGDRGFSQADQLAFWVGMLAQPSDQAMLEDKATGFIVNQSEYDPTRPFKYQTNHLTINMLTRFEPELLNLWMQLYAYHEGDRTPFDRNQQSTALKNGNEADVDMIYMSQPDQNATNQMKHFFSDYINEHEKLAKDKEFIKFYKFMRGADWNQGLVKLRELTKSVVMLKALSENGVFYEDLVRDINQLSNEEFYKKYKAVDTLHIRQALDRYIGEGLVDEFIKQRAGEGDVAFNTRGNVIAMYYMLNGARLREGERNKKLTFLRKTFSNIIGYDMVAMLGEKQTRVLYHKDEEIATVLGPNGPEKITIRQAMNSQRTHATRTEIPVGESVIAITKSQNLNRTLSTHNVTINAQAQRVEDAAHLISNPKFRDKWRGDFAHRSGLFARFKGDRLPHTERTHYIVELLSQIPSNSDQQLEVRRTQIFDLAENLKEHSKIFVSENEKGETEYNVKLGKVYTYTNVKDLIETHFGRLEATKKMALIGALDMRIMYDLQVPKYVYHVLQYLEATREDLRGRQNLQAALDVDAMISKYRDIQAALINQKGNYMPHMFPIARYKTLWMNGMITNNLRKLEEQITYHKKHNTGTKLSRLDLVKDSKEIRQMAMDMSNKQWDIISSGWNKGYIIPNFMQRKMPNADGYTKTDPTIHLGYNTKLIEGLKKDALLADWMTYQANAREAGEREHIMELTRQWYANQIGDRYLASKTQQWGDIKPGQRISFTKSTFIVDPSDDVGYMGTARTSGIVQKVTSDEVTLHIDTDTVLWQAKQDLARWDNIVQSMMIRGTFNNKPTQRQWIIVQNMLNRGFLTQKDLEGMNMTKFTSLDAADAIVTATKRVIKNPQKLGVYKRTEIWGNDVANRPIENAVQRYVGDGSVERLKNKEQELHNLQLMGDSYDGSIPTAQYHFFKNAAAIAEHTLGGFKKLSGLFYMGMGALFKARVVNQMGAVINNLIDAPKYNFMKWKQGNEIWSRIKHGNIETMDPADKELFRVLMGLGLTENNNIMAIALEAANIKPEDMLIAQSTPDSIRWLARLFKDATKYDSTYKALEALNHKYNLESDPTKKLAIKAEMNQFKQKWEAKMYGLLEKETLTKEEETEMWKKLDELKDKEPTVNIAQEQGFTKGMAARLMAKVAWKSFFTSNLGMGFQAKAEKMRIPAFFIGYNTAIDMGFSTEEAIQLGVNSIELRHAYYDSAHKQFGANTKMGNVAFQYAQYQYNAIGKMIRIMREAVPQMLKFAHNRPETVPRLKHLGNMFKLIQNSVDAKGNQLKRGQVDLKEINLLHGIMIKIGATAVMMQIGTRVLYGITNFQDPIGQVVYRGIDFLIDLMENGLDWDDEDDRDNATWMIQDMALPLGLLYKLSIQAMMTAPVKGMDDTFFRGRVDDSFDFVWRVTNTVEDALWELGAVDKRPHKDDEGIIDRAWLTDDFFSGIKMTGWVSADNKSKMYKKRKLYYGIEGQFPFVYFRTETRKKKSFGTGRYVETKGRGISGFGQGGSKTRPYLLLDPFSYIPFLDRLFEGKTLFQTIRGKK